MQAETTVRAVEGMSGTFSTQSTPTTGYRSSLCINEIDDAFTLHLVTHESDNHSSRPLVEAPIPCFTSLLTLSEVQLLKNYNAVFRTPLNQSFGCRMTEVPCSPCKLALQPFEGSYNTTSVFTLCLLLGKLALQSLYCLESAFIQNSPTQTSNKKDFIIGINCHDCICFIQINTNRMNWFSFLNFNLQRNITNELPFLILTIIESIITAFSKYCLK